MKIIPFVFPEDWPELELYPLNDLHVGDSNTDLKLFKNFIKFIQEKPNRQLILVGDLLNNALKTSVSNVYNDSMSPNQQRKFLTKELEPIRDRILCMVSGNHEHRTIKDVDMSPIEWLCESLRVKYFSDNALAIKISFGRGINGKNISYAFWITHGHGGGAQVGSMLNKTETYAAGIENCDGVIVGHVHKRGASAFTSLRLDLHNNQVLQVEKRAIIASAWQDYAGYAMRMMMRPGVKGTKPVMLYGRVKQVEAVV